MPQNTTHITAQNPWFGYPFGMTMEKRSISEGKFGFNGKEKDTDFAEGVYDFGARMYDSRLGRWMSVDPLYPTFPNQSPYNYVYNDIIRKKDIDGKYGSDGHYWTAYTMGILLGLSNEKAIEYAVHAEKYDNYVLGTHDIQNTEFHDRYTWANPLTQGSMHGLTGGNQSDVNMIALLESLNGNEDAIHLLGDSYAHAMAIFDYNKMYERGSGHMNIYGWISEPDNIAKHKSQYFKYLNDLKLVMSANTGIDQNKEIDMTIFIEVAKIDNNKERTDVLKSFIASKVGQDYTTSCYSKQIESALTNSGVNYTVNYTNKSFMGINWSKKTSISINSNSSSNDETE